MNIDEPFIINPDTRKIDVPTGYILGVAGDEKVNRLYFKCPKVVGDNFDLTTGRVYINYTNANGDDNNYLAEDITVVEDDYVIFSWLLYEQVCYKAGSVTFNVCVMRSSLEDESDENHWNTTTAKGKVLRGLEVLETIVEKYPNVIDQIIARLDNEHVLYDEETGELTVSSHKLFYNDKTGELII